MDESPNNSTNFNEPEPMPAAPPQDVPTPMEPEPPVVPTIETPATPEGDIILTPDRKKSKKGLLICLIIVLFLLAGGGAFAAYAIFANQPSNIALSAFGNLLNAKQVALDGSIEITIPDMTGTSEILYTEDSLTTEDGTLTTDEVINYDDADNYVASDNKLTLHFDEQTANSSTSTTATLDIQLADGTTIPSLTLGEVMLDDGVIYVEAKGLGDLYNNVVRDILLSNLVSGVQNSALTNCLETAGAEAIANCQTTLAVVDPAVTAAANTLLDQIGEIVATIDGQWIKISIDDVMNNELFSSVDQQTRQQLSDTYHCAVNTMSGLTNYSEEFSSLYSKYPLIDLQSGDNSFYNVSLNANNIASYLNSVPNTKLYSDLMACNTTETTVPEWSITADDVSTALEGLPQISAKFDGFLSHHLTELKVNGANDMYSLNADLKFSYPNDLNITAPSNARPVMEVVNDVYQQIEGIQANFATPVSSATDANQS